MSRIFLTLSLVSSALLVTALVLGLNIDLQSTTELTADDRVALRSHFLTALGALAFAAFVHAICFTYFMGTGRWLEETTTAYQLPETPVEESRKMKYRALAGIGLCFILLLATGALGAAVDPGANVRFAGWELLPGHTIHFLIAVTMVCVNIMVNTYEYHWIARNGQLIEGVMVDVRRIRTEKGLPTEA